MRIGIDARAYGSDWTGIGRYVRNLLRQITAQSSASSHPLAHAEFVVCIPPRHAREVAGVPRTRIVPVSPSYYSLYEQTGLLRELLSLRADLFHFPHFNVPIFYRRPFVVTIHDLTPFHFPGRKRGGAIHRMAYRSVFRSAVRHARAILTVSQFTEAELLRRFPTLRGNTRVVYEGIDALFLRDDPRPAPAAVDLRVLQRFGITQPYLLSVGVWRTHKNLSGLLRAFRLAREQGFRGILVVTGAQRNPWDDDVRAFARMEGVSDAVVTPGWVSDDELATLYRSATACLVPSLSEGFGLPPLEAMASGTPVVAARSGSLPEILGDAAFFATPQDPASFASAVVSLVRDHDLRARMVRRGVGRAAQFSWERCGRETLAVYCEALGLPRVHAEQERVQRMPALSGG